MKISIITINRNNAVGLKKTIESVVFQSLTDFEYIIIDGASIDESVGVIKEFANNINYWVSEPDKGVYNAMNKGIFKAQGEYLLFLNSGDWLADENVLLDFYNANIDGDIIFGNILLINNDKIDLKKTQDQDDFGFEHFYFGGYLPHQSSFIKLNLFRLYGLYNEEYKIASDLDFFVKCLLVNNASYSHFDRVISFYDLTGISSQEEFEVLHQNERENIFNTHLPLFYKSYNKMVIEKCRYESANREYMNLKNGKFSIIIKLLLMIKKKFK